MARRRTVAAALVAAVAASGCGAPPEPVWPEACGTAAACAEQQREDAAQEDAYRRAVERGW